MKRIWAVGIVVCAAIAFSIGFEQYKADRSIRLVHESLNILNEGNYAEGLNRCDQADFGKGVCYISAVGLQLGEVKRSNRTYVDPELCARIPDKIKMPFWTSRSYMESASRDLNIARTRCSEATGP